MNKLLNLFQISLYISQLIYNPFNFKFFMLDISFKDIFSFELFSGYSQSLFIFNFSKFSFVFKIYFNFSKEEEKFNNAFSLSVKTFKI